MKPVEFVAVRILLGRSLIVIRASVDVIDFGLGSPTRGQRAASGPPDCIVGL